MMPSYEQIQFEFLNGTQGLFTSLLGEKSVDDINIVR